MTAPWVVVLGLLVGTVAIKAAGPLTVGGRELPERVLAVVSLVAPALVAALVVYETFSAEDGAGLVLDARVVGLGAAALAAWARLPMLAVIVLAAAATALTRLLW
jgi:branched-subunit amino acid transport protein